MDFFRAAGDIWRKADRAAGGWLPGGGTPSPVTRAVIAPARAALEKSIRDAALNTGAAISNTLPDRVNLYTRYVTGLGNRNLELDPSTLQALRAATERTPSAKVELFPGDVTVGDMNLRLSPISRRVPTHGPGVPVTGAVNPYGYYRNAPNSVTNTLGRFNAYVDPVANTVTFKDTYDMVNEAEDPDLVSGKSQPWKAWKSIESIWNRDALDELRFGAPSAPKYPLSGVGGNQGELGVSSSSRTFSPATQLGRALLYALPVKPPSYEVEATVPLFSRY